MDLSLEIPEYFVTGRSKIEEQWLPCTLDGGLRYSRTGYFLVPSILMFSPLDCLRAFTEVEELSAVCKDCGAPQRCSKRYVMEQLPEVSCSAIVRSGHGAKGYVAAFRFCACISNDSDVA